MKMLLAVHNHGAVDFWLLYIAAMALAETFSHKAASCGKNLNTWAVTCKPSRCWILCFFNYIFAILQNSLQLVNLRHMTSAFMRNMAGGVC